MRRFYDVTEVPLPFSIRLESRLCVPDEGEYRFSCKPFAGWIIKIQQTEVFNNYANFGAPRQTPIRLKAGEAVHLEARGSMGGGLQNRTFKLYYRKNGELQDKPVPLAWLQLEL